MHVKWNSVCRIQTMGRSQEEIDSKVLEIARDQLKSLIPRYLESHHNLGTDNYVWKRKTFYTTSKGVSVAVYRCPLHFSCACKSLLRVKRDEGLVHIETSHEHNVDSHKNSYVKNLSPAQKEAVITAVRGDPGVSSTGIRRQCDPTTHIPVEMQRSVRYLCKQERQITSIRELGGVRLIGSIASFDELKDALWFTTALER